MKEQHAGHLMDTRLKKRKEEKEQRNAIPRALSTDDLLISDLPQDRTYMVFPEEKYLSNNRYMQDEDDLHLNSRSAKSANGQRGGSAGIDRGTGTQDVSKRGKELEKQLRLCYRPGHLDEIKRNIFRRVYTETRKHYMDLERHEFLNKLAEKQKLRKKHEEKKKEEKPKQAEVLDERSVSLTGQFLCVRLKLVITIGTQGNLQSQRLNANPRRRRS